MKLTPLAPRPAAIAEALARRGFPGTQADAAAAGLESAAVVVDALEEPEREALTRVARMQGIASLSGSGWVLLAGDTARLAGLARPGGTSGLPAALATPLGAALHGTFSPPEAWAMARGIVALDRPRIMGILNVTPDSFSDGGQWLDPDAALAHAERLLADGADLLDVGAESTRPGRPAPVTAAEEWRRLGPVVGDLVRRFPSVPLSVDTVKAETARRALDAGAWAINDVTGLRLDPGVADVCAEHGAGLIVMHSRGRFAELATYEHATYDVFMMEVAEELEGMARTAEQHGIERGRIAVDPGFGFGKRPEQNLQLLDRLAALRALGRPIVVGPSRKRFLGVATGREVGERDVATAAACVLAAERGAQIFRVHAVPEARDALRLTHAVRTA
ncbi:MAG: dihydropteroate synthase [Gemmatimonadota bacterium]|nr:dihydropteroate synthase [Gemmatimonadota bacterium]